MNYLRNALNLLIVGFLLFSCQRDKLGEDISINQFRTEQRSPGLGTPNASLIGTPRNLDLVQNFYDDLLSLQQRTRFYDGFYEAYGYIDWSRTQEFSVQEGGQILTVPVHRSGAGASNGLFLYYDNGADQKISFHSRVELQAKVAAQENTILNSDELFAYRNLALHELKKRGWSEDYSYDILTIIGEEDEDGTAEGGGPGEEPTGPEECEGGSYQWVCAYMPAIPGTEEIDGGLINAYIASTYGNGNAIRDQYDGWSFSELEANYNRILANIWAGHRSAFIQYFQDRERLFNDTGLGDGNDGILIGTIETLIRDCQWVWVWCWQDPFDLEISLGGGSGGGSGSYTQPWDDNYDFLRLCEGVNDVFDEGPENPGSVHPHYDDCVAWIEYLENCIVPNLPEAGDPTVPLGYGYEEAIEQWAQLQEFEPELFELTINNLHECVPTNELNDHISEYRRNQECGNALSTFESVYGTAFSGRDRARIWEAFEEDESSPLCGEQEAFDEWLLELIGNGISKKPGEGELTYLEELFRDCFGEPNSDGDYVDCNQVPTGSQFSLTLYADQPSPGSRLPFIGAPFAVNVGHTFISLTTDYTGTEKNLTFGFYPAEEVDLENPIVPMAIFDDSNHGYSSSVTISLSCEEFNQALNRSISASNSDYDLNEYNCTDYGIIVANAVGLGVLDTTSPWVLWGHTFGHSSNPGDLGEDIKDLGHGEINPSGGAAPDTNCN